MKSPYGNNPDDSDSGSDNSDGRNSVKEAVSEDNVNYKKAGLEGKSKFSLLEAIKWLFYQNPFMERLFPLIKQQKPGTDLYVYIATIQIILVAYVFIFYSNMQGSESDITTQFEANQYSSNMVILLIVMICVIVVDRVFYSTHAFLSGSKITYEELGQSKSPSNEAARTNGRGHNESSLMDESTLLHRESGQPL